MTDRNVEKINWMHCRLNWNQFCQQNNNLSRKFLFAKFEVKKVAWMKQKLQIKNQIEETSFWTRWWDEFSLERDRRLNSKWPSISELYNACLVPEGLTFVRAKMFQIANYVQQKQLTKLIHFSICKKFTCGILRQRQ